MKRARIVATCTGVLLLAAAAQVPQQHSAQASTTNDVMMMRVTGAGTSCAPLATAPTSCTVPLSGHFNLVIAFNAPPSEGFIGVITELDYSELVAHGGSYKPAATASAEIIWPCVAFCSRSPEPPTGNEGLVHHFGSTSAPAPFPPTHYQGDGLQLTFTCSETPSSNYFVLVPFEASNKDGSGFKAADQSVTAAKRSLSVICSSAVGGMAELSGVAAMQTRTTDDVVRRTALVAILSTLGLGCAVMCARRRWC